MLFPGAAQPLHIFEPRYRRLLADCLAADRRFGLIHIPEELAELELPAGRVGCVAQIEQVAELPDGRSNIIVLGEERFVFERYETSPQPYHVGRVRELADQAEPAPPLDALAGEVRALFARAADAARTLVDDRAPLPELPDSPAMLSFRVASLIDLGQPERYQVLASRSPTERLRAVEAVLRAAIAPLEGRAALHQRAKLNGRGRATPGPAS